MVDPSMINGRVVPGDLEDYRRCHDFMAPCCLCAFVDKVAYTETVIGIVAAGATSDPHFGVYVARCAKERCGYSGKQRSVCDS
jgi:hypothetical protein